ncbi:MAG: phosphatase PAP2 family protein [Prevotella sp.]|nr:phosphatase PAP2 family protein [Prevotella sp.]
MDLDQILDLDRQLLLAFNGSDSLFLDGLVKTLTTAATWIPLYVSLLYVVLKNNDNLQKVLLIVVCAGLCVFFAGSLNDMIVKPLVERWRPSHDDQIGMAVDVVNGYRGGDYGFFSSHASNTFSIAIFFALLVRSRVLTVALVVWSLANCWTRLYLGVHFPGDILCGLLWGGLVGTGVWLLHYKMSRRFSGCCNYISSHYTPTGYDMDDVDVVISVLVMTLLYAIFRACLYLYS